MTGRLAETPSAGAPAVEGIGMRDCAAPGARAAEASLFTAVASGAVRRVPTTGAPCAEGALMLAPAPAYGRETSVRATRIPEGETCAAPPRAPTVGALRRAAGATEGRGSGVTFRAIRGVAVAVAAGWNDAGWLSVTRVPGSASASGAGALRTGGRARPAGCARRWPAFTVSRATGRLLRLFVGDVATHTGWTTGLLIDGRAWRVVGGMADIDGAAATSAEPAGRKSTSRSGWDKGAGVDESTGGTGMVEPVGRRAGPGFGPTAMRFSSGCTRVGSDGEATCGRSG